MRETAQDIANLQRLLDASYAAAGPHLLSIHTEDRRLSADQLVARVRGMCLLVLATVTADGRPLTGPVDGIFYRGAWHFGSDSRSVRLRHIARRPQVSATHLPSEELAITVHGRAVLIDIHAPEHADFRQTVLDIYVPQHGSEWEGWLDTVPAYARIDAERIFALRVAAPEGA